MKNQPDAVLQHFTALVRMFPERRTRPDAAGNVYFGRQEYTAADRVIS